MGGALVAHEQRLRGFRQRHHGALMDDLVIPAHLSPRGPKAKAVTKPGPNPSRPANSTSVCSGRSGVSGSAIAAAERGMASEGEAGSAGIASRGAVGSVLLMATSCCVGGITNRAVARLPYTVNGWQAPRHIQLEQGRPPSRREVLIVRYRFLWGFLCPSQMPPRNRNCDAQCAGKASPSDVECWAMRQPILTSTRSKALVIRGREGIEATDIRSCTGHGPGHLASYLARQMPEGQ